MNRRKFLTSAGQGIAAMPAALSAASGGAPAGLQGASLSTSIDHRYTPVSWQTAYCFAADAFKSLVGEHGELRYGNPGRGKPNDYFTDIVGFSLLGMEADRLVVQQLENPATAVIHTQLGRPEANLHLTTFATNEPGELRVDNVIVEVSPTVHSHIHGGLVISIRTRRKLAARRTLSITVVHRDGEPDKPFLIADAPLMLRDAGWGYILTMAPRAGSGDRPARCFLRFPQQEQNVEQIGAGLRDPARLLTSARTYWRNWQAFGGKVDWKLCGPYQNFLIACARNIQQAREVVKGQLTFQVGPTCYRGLWVVDGHFLLEAARYLGYDAEAQKGLETTWAYQTDGGGVFAGAGTAHWKDTGISMFSLVRQAELAQDWSYFREMKPNVLRGVNFLASLRDKARAEGSANGRYGLLPRGMGDGGLGGIRSEFTNTIWVLAGLKATFGAAEQLRLTGYEPVRALYEELRSAFFTAARQEMRKHPDGFEYLPMLMKEDPQWSDPDEWQRPRPQAAQWALSHAIYPGLVFPQNDPVVRGHIRLMQSCTQEDVPAETGWLPHEGLWTYNAPFVAHAYLWANEPDWARLAFTGFLNHSTPLYCWREEQPLRGSLVSGYVGDMPHNWASAECILYLRHMLALEDGPDLRLLAGIGEPELDTQEAYVLRSSPTRFGRLTMVMEPQRGRTWRLEFQRAGGPAPNSIVLPAAFGSRFQLTTVEGCAYKQAGGSVSIDPSATSWTATWRA
jgi:hypothetical protein